MQSNFKMHLLKVELDMEKYLQEQIAVAGEQRKPASAFESPWRAASTSGGRFLSLVWWAKIFGLRIRGRFEKWKMRRKWRNSEHHNTWVEEQERKGHELALVGSEWRRRAAWIVTRIDARSRPPRQESLTESAASQHRRKGKCQIKKVRSRCSRVAVEAAKRAGWAPSQWDSRCWLAWCSHHRILGQFMLPEKLKQQILKTTAADFGNQENTKLEIFYEQPCTSATHEHHRCQPSSDSQEQPLSRSW